MKFRYPIYSSIFYILILSLIVFKNSYADGNIINMLFSVSSLVVVFSLVKLNAVLSKDMKNN